MYTNNWKCFQVENVAPKKDLHLNIEPVQASGSVNPVDTDNVSGKNENCKFQYFYYHKNDYNEIRIKVNF